ncbi:hypothetical protein HYFRA_00000666 [Hymenoscyphus fraxineus]|uniref:Carbonic anhydrase n=1 Tax=Hymenoscyphus fraxineus TaxID=746836 RepID=A0A9N9PSQ5_9HELO|nr:hypothetical protein HYFRA_00000666 [Hymenoscyphus fraxineus]
MQNSTVTELLQRNKAIVAGHQALPFFPEFKEAGVPPHPTFVDGVVVCRNVGGHIGPAMKDIIALDAYVGLATVMIIHHTDCGTLHFTDAIIREKLIERLPHQQEIDTMEFGSIKECVIPSTFKPQFTDSDISIGLEQSVMEDLKMLRENPLVRKDLAQGATGYIFDIKTGVLSPVEG